MSRGVVEQYARAYLEAMAEAGASASARTDMALLDGVFDGGPGLLVSLQSPSLSPAQRLAAVRHAFEGHVHACTVRLLCLCLANGRSTVIPELPSAVDTVLAEREGTVRARVTSARPLDKRVRERLVQGLAARTGTNVSIEYRLDPRLGAGFQVVYNDTLIDASARGALRRLRQELITAHGNTGDSHVVTGAAQ